MPGAEKSQSRQPPWETGGDAEPIPFGTWLRRQRELRQVSLREIAEVTKISTRYLEALEEDRFDVLPAPVFARGFLREYARYVGLDPDEVVNTYLTAQSQAQPEEEPEPWKARRQPSVEWTSALLLALAVVVVLALVALIAFYAERSRKAAVDQPPPVAVPAPEVPPPPAAPVESAPAAPLVVIMDFAEDCWVEATVDGQRRLSELHVQGESLRLEADESVVLTLGNPQGVQVELNGRPFDLRPRAGRIVRDLIIDLETARALAGDGDDD